MPKAPSRGQGWDLNPGLLNPLDPVQTGVVLQKNRRLRRGGARRKPAGWDFESLICIWPIVYHMVPGTW